MGGPLHTVTAHMPACQIRNPRGRSLVIVREMLILKCDDGLTASSPRTQQSSWLGDLTFVVAQERPIVFARYSRTSHVRHKQPSGLHQELLLATEQSDVGSRMVEVEAPRRIQGNLKSSTRGCRLVP